MAGVLCASVFAVSQTDSSKPPKITEEHRVNLIRGLQAEHAFAKIALPQGKKGITLKDGKISPGQVELGRIVMKEGPSSNVGDRVLITNMIMEGDKIVFTVSFDGGGGEMKIVHEGTIKGDEITLKIKMGDGGDGPGGEMTLKRAK